MKSMIAYIKQIFCSHRFECMNGAGSTFKCKKCGKIEGIFG